MLTSAVTDDGQQSGELLNNLSMHDDFGAAFEQCLGACPHLGGRAKGCHTSCANYVPITLRALLLKVLAYQYEPSPHELARRMRWLRLQVTSLLRHAKPHLPQEICSQIADYSLQDTALHQYAVMQTRTLPIDRKNDSSRVRASVEIWAHFVDFEGVQYIASLSNTRDDYHAESVFRPIATQAVDCVYVAQNYLGVMRVLFCSSTQPPALDRHQGLWWKIIPLRREMVLVTKTDVSALATKLGYQDKARLMSRRVSSFVLLCQRMRILDLILVHFCGLSLHLSPSAWFNWQREVRRHLNCRWLHVTSQLLRVIRFFGNFLSLLYTPISWEKILHFTRTLKQGSGYTFPSRKERRLLKSGNVEEAELA